MERPVSPQAHRVPLPQHLLKARLCPTLPCWDNCDTWLPELISCLQIEHTKPLVSPYPWPHASLAFPPFLHCAPTHYFPSTPRHFLRTYRPKVLPLETLVLKFVLKHNETQEKRVIHLIKEDTLCVSTHMCAHTWTHRHTHTACTCTHKCT